MGEERSLRTPGISRRSFVGKSAALGAATLGLPATLSGCLGGDDETETGSPRSGGQPRRGGRLRIAYIGGGTSETIDPYSTVSIIDGARASNIFDALVEFNPDLSLRNALAESFEPNSGSTEWTVRLRPGVTFHDGSPLTADDLIHTLRTTASPETGNSGKLAIQYIDLPAVRKLDARTVRIPLTQPHSEFSALFTIAPLVSKKGATDYARPIGTGPFQFVSFTPGQESLFKRNPDYWDEGKPYVDELQMISIPDQSARLNALLSDQVDAMESLTYPQAQAQQEQGQINVLEAAGSNMVPIYMAVDLEPFRDVRVRQAMRLLADRKQLVEAAQLGFGEVGNDLYGKGLQYYADELPQREQDTEQARSLLRAAGRSDLRVSLITSTTAQGMLESATVFSRQAREAGVTVEVNQIAADRYFGENYLKQNFAQSLWFTELMSGHYARSTAKGAPFNEQHWESAESFNRWQKLYLEALATQDEGRKEELYLEVQRIMYEEGGYLIWGFFPLLDGLSKKVQGAVANPAAPLGGGSRVADWWLA